MFRPELKLVHEDGRGEMYVITLPDNREVMLLHSVKGSLRGGHAHDAEESTMLLTGKIQYSKRDHIGEWAEVLTEGSTTFNPIGRFHKGEFLEDSWLLEWKIGVEKDAWHNIDDPEWRKEVMDNAAG